MSTRTTKSQNLILSLLKKTEEETSAQQLHYLLRQQGSKIGLATVYRTLKSLLLEGMVQERVTPTGESLYSLITNSHHHHLNCVNCGQSVPIDACPIGQKLTEWCHSQKFTVYYHTLEFFGLCSSCQKELDAH